MMKITLEDKINLAKDEIKKHYQLNNGNIFVSFSGGKDSTVLRHIAVNLYPDIKVVFSDTTNELAEIYKYIKTFDNVIKVHPTMTFTNVIEKHGFPLVSKETSQKVYELKNSQGQKTKNTRLYGDDKGHGKLSKKWRFLAEQEFDCTHKCCKILKKDPLDKWAKKNNMKALVGIMAGESALRDQLSKKQKEFYGDKIYPFLQTGWTDKDIWDYSKKFNIRFAECYYEQVVDGVVIPPMDRTGCEYCGFGITLENKNRFERSKMVSPKRYKKMMNLQNRGIRFSEAIDIVMRKDLPKPVLGLYGYEIIAFDEKDDIHFELKPLHSRKRCKHCNSSSIIKKGIMQKFFFDTPMNGKRVSLHIKVQKYFCNECSKVSKDFLPWVAESKMMTDRYIEYIKKEK